jgi:hypothetical protein
MTDLRGPALKKDRFRLLKKREFPTIGPGGGGYRYESNLE